MTREEWQKYIEETYSANAEYVFERYPDTCVFRHESNRKWFAVIMEVERKSLGLEGDGRILLLNTKCDFILISSYLSEKGHFPAYHMNKAHWISTALDGAVDEDRIRLLIEMSFESTKPKRKTPKKL